MKTDRAASRVRITARALVGLVAIAAVGVACSAVEPVAIPASTSNPPRTTIERAPVSEPPAHLVATASPEQNDGAAVPPTDDGSCEAVASLFEAIIVLDYLDTPIHPVTRSLAFEGIVATIEPADRAVAAADPAADRAVAAADPAAGLVTETEANLLAVFGLIVEHGGTAEAGWPEEAAGIVAGLHDSMGRLEAYLIDGCGYQEDSTEGDAATIAADYTAIGASAVEGTVVEATGQAPGR